MDWSLFLGLGLIRMVVFFTAFGSFFSKFLFSGDICTAHGVDEGLWFFHAVSCSWYLAVSISHLPPHFIAYTSPHVFIISSPPMCSVCLVFFSFVVGIFLCSSPFSLRLGPANIIREFCSVFFASFVLFCVYYCSISKFFECVWLEDVSLKACSSGSVVGCLAMGE